MARWLEAHRHDNDFHVVGPFLMAEEAVWGVAPPEVAVVGTLRPGQSRLGPVLNRAGLYFYQIPNMYTAGDLGIFKAIVVDKGALDRNDADIKAYYETLMDYAARGGTLVYFSQEDEQLLLKALPPGIDFKREIGGRLLVETDSDWMIISLGPEKEVRIAVRRLGQGKVVYCSDYPPDSLAGEPEAQSTWRQEYLRLLRELIDPRDR